MIKNPPASAGDIRAACSVPELGRFPERGNGNALQYSCLENPMDKGAWPATVCGVIKSQTQLTNSDTHTHTHGHFIFSHSLLMCNPIVKESKAKF